MSDDQATGTPLRIGLVEYANTAPLSDGLPEERVRRGVPAQVADWLARGEVDLGLVPAIELGRIAGLRVIPRWGIAGDGHCESVLLFCRVPLREVRTVTLDAASRTAAALTRILLQREGAEGVRYLKREGGTVEERLADADATLLIGDPALRATPPEGVTSLDLATEWKRHVGLPFVFACWASRAGRLLTEEEVALVDAAGERGTSRLGELAERESARTGLPAARLLAYLRNLDYRLEQPHLRGLRAFLDEAHRVGVLPERASVTFYP